MRSGAVVPAGVRVLSAGFPEQAPVARHHLPVPAGHQLPEQALALFAAARAIPPRVEAPLWALGAGAHWRAPAIEAQARARAGVGPWSYEPLVPQTRLRGEVFGIVGLGRIGTATALRATS